MSTKPLYEQLADKLTVYETLRLFRSFYREGRNPDELLRDLSQDLLLPGLEDVPPDTLGLLEENHAFTLPGVLETAAGVVDHLLAERFVGLGAARARQRLGLEVLVEDGQPGVERREECRGVAVRLGETEVATNRARVTHPDVGDRRRQCCGHEREDQKQARRCTHR